MLNDIIHKLQNSKVHFLGPTGSIPQFITARQLEKEELSYLIFNGHVRKVFLGKIPIYSMDKPFFLIKEREDD